MPWLFAYGSLTNPQQFKKIAGKWKYARKAILPNYRLVFSGRGSADILHAPDSAQVYGVLFEISEQQLGLLDRYEGVPTGFYRRERVTVKLPSRERSAYVFVKEKKEPFKHPSSRYLKQLVEGLRFHGYSDTIIKEIRHLIQSGPSQ